jgi:hypothetical protein
MPLRIGSAWKAATSFKKDGVNLPHTNVKSDVSSSSHWFRGLGFGGSIESFVPQSRKKGVRMSMLGTQSMSSAETTVNSLPLHDRLIKHQQLVEGKLEIAACLT